MVKIFPTTKHCSIVTRIHKPTFGYGEHRTLQTISCQTMTCTVASKLTINCQIMTCTVASKFKDPKHPITTRAEIHKKWFNDKSSALCLTCPEIYNHRDAHFIFPRVHGVVTIMFFSEHMPDLSTSVWEHQTLF